MFLVGDAWKIESGIVTSVHGRSLFTTTRESYGDFLYLHKTGVTFSSEVGRCAMRTNRTQDWLQVKLRDGQTSKPSIGIRSESWWHSIVPGEVGGQLGLERSVPARLMYRYMPFPLSSHDLGT